MTHARPVSRGGDEKASVIMQNNDDSKDGEKPLTAPLSRRSFVAAGSAGLATVALRGIASAQTPAPASDPPPAEKAAETVIPQYRPPVSDPGPINATLLKMNPSANNPPPTDHGDTGPIWYSFNLSHRREQPGGWTHQVTERSLPTSTDIAGVDMRLNTGAYRELHWHTAAEWSFMLYGNARISVLNPDGTVFLKDVSRGDLWYFPAGYPHSIQGLEPDGCEFLLIFDQGEFSEEDTFLLSDWVRHTPPDVLAKNMNLSPASVAKFPNHDLYIFPGKVPPSLATDKESVGGPAALSPTSFSFNMMGMKPAFSGPGGSAIVVDSRSFPVSKTVASALVTVHPGAMRELHWHPNASEWQFYISGQARMTVFITPSQARTMDYHEGDVGFVPLMAGHYIENTGNTDLVYLEIFRAPEFIDFSLNNWLRHLPPEMVSAHLNISADAIRRIPSQKNAVLI